MFDLARVVALAFAISACRRARYAVGAAASLVIGALLAWEIVAPLARHAVGEGGAGPAFAFVFVGPSRIAPRTWMTLVEALVASLASRVAFARARPLRPEGDDARALDRVALRFLFVAVLDAVVAVFDLLIVGLMREG